MSKTNKNITLEDIDRLVDEETSRRIMSGCMTNERSWVMFIVMCDLKLTVKSQKDLLKQLANRDAECNAIKGKKKN